MTYLNRKRKTLTLFTKTTILRRKIDSDNSYDIFNLYFNSNLLITLFKQLNKKVCKFTYTLSCY